MADGADAWVPRYACRWTALRQDAYGYGTLEVSPTKAEWNWHRIADSWNPNPAGVGDSATYNVKQL